jgi:hypothetical protein
MRYQQRGSWGWRIALLCVPIVCITTDASSVTQQSSTTSRRRQIVHFGSMDDIREVATLNRKLSAKLTLVGNRKNARAVAVEEDDDDTPENSKLWPPWPFNLIGKQKKNGQSLEDGYPSTGALFWAYLRQRSRIGIRQIQQRK